MIHSLLALQMEVMPNGPHLPAGAYAATGGGASVQHAGGGHSWAARHKVLLAFAAGAGIAAVITSFQTHDKTVYVAVPTPQRHCHR